MAEQRTLPAAADEAIPRTGQVIAGKYEIESVLGEGGMGVVFAARHTKRHQRVAVKVLRSEAAKLPEAVERFMREARAATVLRGEHVVHVSNVGVLDGGLPYMMMELLDGTDMEAMLQSRGKLEITETIDYVLQAMEGVAEAHAMGIVHRDLKPANLFVANEPDGSSSVKVLDFGISKAVAGNDIEASLTTTSSVLGSPFYMSPEQLRSSKSVDLRTDVWSLGVILYELVSGKPPFDADTATGLCAKIVLEPPTPLRKHLPDVPLALEAVIMRALEKNVTLRWRSVAELAVALEPFASNEGARSIPRIKRLGAERSRITVRPEDVPTDPRHGAARRGLPLPAIAVGALIVGVGAALAIRLASHPSPSATPAAVMATVNASVSTSSSSLLSSPSPSPSPSPSSSLSPSPSPSPTTTSASASNRPPPAPPPPPSASASAAPASPASASASAAVPPAFPSAQWLEERK